MNLVPEAVLLVELWPVNDGFLRASAFLELNSSRLLPGRTRTANGEKSVPQLFGMKSLEIQINIMQPISKRFLV